MEIYLCKLLNIIFIYNLFGVNCYIDNVIVYKVEEDRYG